MRWSHLAVVCDDSGGDGGPRFERAMARLRAERWVLFHLEHTGGEEGPDAGFTASQWRAGRQDAPSDQDKDASSMRRHVSCATGVKGAGWSAGRKRVTAVGSERMRRRASRYDRRRLRALGMIAVTMREVPAGPGAAGRPRTCLVSMLRGQYTRRPPHFTELVYSATSIPQKAVSCKLLCTPGTLQKPTRGRVEYE